jgi:hypothetical protein
MTSSQERSLCFIDHIEQYDMDDWAEEGTLSSKNTEQEDVWDWVSGIGKSVAQGAATGAAAGPWGALIGGLTGAGLGAVQTASQPQKQDKPASPPQGTQPRPPNQVLSPPSIPASPTTAPSGAGQTPSGKISGISPELIQQLLQLLPLITQLLAQQSRATSTGSAGAESEDGQDNGDYVPDDAFLADEGTYSGNGEAAEANEMAEGGRVREDESMWDWIVTAGSSTYTGEWTQESSLEIAPPMEWSVESSHFVWKG